MVGDHDRPLNQRGRRAAQRLARHFQETGIRPELVLCSSALRARQTLQPISQVMSLADRTRIEPRLYGATADEVLTLVRGVDDGTTSVLVVGHNPGLQDLALELAGGEPDTVSQLSQRFPTGTLAEIVAGCPAWSSLGHETARIRSLTVPRELPD